MTAVSPSTLEDARAVAANIRDADARECDALLALPPSIALPMMIGPGVRTLRSSLEDAIFGMGGVRPVEGVPGLATVWFVGTNEIQNHKREFLLDSRLYVDEVQQDFRVLTNFVDARNTSHIRWLKWLGFKLFNRVERWGARSLPFYEFARVL